VTLAMGVIVLPLLNSPASRQSLPNGCGIR
jgi:hypothetical protein